MGGAGFDEPQLELRKQFLDIIEKMMLGRTQLEILLPRDRILQDVTLGRWSGITRRVDVFEASMFGHELAGLGALSVAKVVDYMLANNTRFNAKECAVATGINVYGVMLVVLAALSRKAASIIE